MTGIARQLICAAASRVPVSREFWSVDPLAGRIQDDYVWGREALDMKGRGIVQLMTLIAINRAGIPLTRDLVYIANADEESGGLGSRTIISRHPELIGDVRRGVHGNDQRVSIENLGFGLKLYAGVLEEMQ